MPDASGLEHGIFITESSDVAAALNTVTTSIIGAVVTAPMADVALFPVNTPVLITAGKVAAAITAVGEQGTAATVLRAIADIARAPVVLIRVVPGVDADATNAAVIGADTAGAKSGMQALLSAEAKLGVKPRILGIPGLEDAATIAALVVVAQKLRARAYCGAIGATLTEATTFANGFDARELTLCWPDFIATNGSGAAATSYAGARAIALRSLLDTTVGFHKTISNVAVPGVIGITKDVDFDPQSATCDANLLNAGNVVALIRTASGGFRFWGNITTASDTDFQFESDCRTAQILMDTIAEGLLPANDQPMTVSFAKSLVQEIDATMSRMVRKGQLIGGSATLDPAKNPAAQLASGEIEIDYDYTAVSPAQRIGLTQRKTDTYYANFASAVSGNSGG